MVAAIPAGGPRSLPALAVMRSPLGVGLVASVLLHLLALMLKFAPPEPIRFAPSDSQIEVILLNAQTEQRPLTADVRAQVDMEGGGDRDEGRARSPLPAESKVSDGTDLMLRRQRVEELEERQRRLLALARGPQSFVADGKRADLTEPTPNPADADETSQVIARLQAQIDRQISDYNKRPKRLTFGVNAIGVNYAKYVEEWASRIERIGTERYPPEARGRMYDSLIITVEIDKHGNVVDVIINRKSKFEALNRAVRQIVYAGAPYPRFPPEMARDGDILQIVRTWIFTNDSLATESVKAP